MPYFFTDPAMLGEQPSGKNFGRVSNTKYNLSMGLISRRNDIFPTAYAVTSGRIAVLEAQTSISVPTGSNNFQYRVFTIVLQPDSQPGGSIPNIKYYIYKGIEVNSFFVNQIVDDVIPNPNPQAPDERTLLNTSAPNLAQIQFMGRIQNSYNNWVADPPEGFDPAEPLNEDWLGIYRSEQVGVETLDEIFNNNWGAGSPPLPRVNEGECIGRFVSKNHSYGAGANGEFAFEIILDGIGHNPKLAAAKGGGGGFEANYRSLDVSNHLSTYKRAKNRHVRMEVLQYMDPCAYYGAFANVGMPNLRVINSGVLQPIVPASAANNNRANAIYSQLLTLPGMDHQTTPAPLAADETIFKNYNRIYIDIRDRYNLPYDWLRDKTPMDVDEQQPPNVVARNYNLRLDFNLFLGVNVNPNTLDYYGEGALGGDDFTPPGKRGWPILAIDLNNSNVGSPLNGFPNLLPNPNTMLTNLLAPAPLRNRIALEFPRPFNVDMDSCIHINNGGVIAPGATITGSDGFIELQENMTGEWALPVTVETPNFNGGAFATPIANYIKIWHFVGYKSFFDKSKVDQSTFYGEGYEPGLIGTGTKTDDPEPIEKHPHDYGEFVWPLDVTLNWTNFPETSIRSTIYSVKTFFDNIAVSGGSFMGHVGIARDANANAAFPNHVPKVTFFIYNTIPSNASINYLDQTFPESANFRFSDNPSYLTNIAGNTRDFKLISRAVQTNLTPVPIQVDHLQGLTPAELAALDLISPGGRAPGTTVNDFVFFQMNKVDYDQAITDWELVKANNLTTIKPLKEWWSFEPIDSGWSQDASMEYVVYRINLKYLNDSSGIPNPLKIETYNTGFTTVKLMDKVNIGDTPVNSPANESGFDIVNIGGVENIICNINFVKGPSLNYDEFLSYKDYALRNIKQIWTNPEGAPTSDPYNEGNSLSDYSNSGLTAASLAEGNGRVNAINAYKITASQGTCKSFQSLPDNEISILVERTVFANQAPNTWTNDRAHIATDNDITTDAGGNEIAATSSRRQGRFVFYQAAGVVDNSAVFYTGGNVPAHEFGHVLGLTDRYTYSANTNVNDAILGNSAELLSLYLPDNFDIAYTSDYRWIMNLMGPSTRKVPNYATLPLGHPFLTLHVPTFPNAIAGFNSADNIVNTNGFGGNIFITPFQWSIVQMFKDDSEEFEDNRNKRPQYSRQNYAYFIASQDLVNPNTHGFGGFVGFDSDTGTAVSDHDFVDAAGAHKMIDRIGSVVLGYFSPFDPDTSGMGDPLNLVNVATANDPSQMFHVRMGNNLLTSVFPSIVRIDATFSAVHPAPIDPATLGPFAPPRVLFAVGDPVHGAFDLVGTSDPLGYGRIAWNYIRNNGADTEIYRYPNVSGIEFTHNFNFFTIYDNRDEIIQLIVNGGF